MTHRVASFTLGSLFLSLSIGLSSAGAQDDLDQQLLGDLESELLKDLETPPPTQKQDSKKDQQSAGEDPETPKQSGPLRRIMERMRLAEQRIAAADASEKTQQVQQDVLNDLDQLIAQLQKQCAQCQQSGGSPKPSSGRPKPGNSAARRPSDKPSADSRERMDSAKKSGAKGLDPQQLVKEVWGHLPAKVVEQMTRQSVDKFLPKYEQLIEDYFRRLAEDQESLD